MKKLTLILSFLAFAACSKKTDLSSLKAQSPVDPQLGNIAAPVVLPQGPTFNGSLTPPDIPLCIARDILDTEKEWSMAIHEAYSSHDFNSHDNLTWCKDGACNETSKPSTCDNLITFDDFTIYSKTSATFFNSIPEPVSIDPYSQSITLTSNMTGHKDMVFKYKYFKDNEEWVVTYGDNCSRRYQHALFGF